MISSNINITLEASNGTDEPTNLKAHRKYKKCICDQISYFMPFYAHHFSRHFFFCLVFDTPVPFES